MAACGSDDEGGCTGDACDAGVCDSGACDDAATDERDAATDERDAATDERDAATDERDAATDERDAATDETDAGCQGSACPECDNDDDCSGDAHCDDGECVDPPAPTCTDEAKNGQETDEDCGGPVCAPCADGLSCSEGSDCESAVCNDGECAEPTCEDETHNGDETDEDCGGSCDPCERGDGCAIDEDCVTGHCATTCVIGPTAGFKLTGTSIDVPTSVTATSTATAGDGAIATIEYDWGSGFESAATHPFGAAGTYPVTQRVTDENGLIATATLNVSAYLPVHISATDKSDHVVVSDNGVVVAQINHNNNGGARSDRSVASGDGVFYFEGSRLGSFGYYGWGVGTSTTDFTTYLGKSDHDIGFNTIGHVTFDDTVAYGPFSETTGFVIDYRGTSPVVHVIVDYGGGDHARLRAETLNTTAPVFAMYAGFIEKHGPCVKFNFGNDTTNFPFALDPVAALEDAGESAVADALVMGFGQTRARPVSAAPVLTTSGDMSVASGTEVMLTASATDAEDGDLTASILWENLATSIMDREKGTGGSFKFTPPEIGKYPIRVTVKDAFGVAATHTIMVEATGTLPQLDPVRLIVNDDTGEGIMLSPDGLSVQYTLDIKAGIHANQGLYGRFWYFEMTRHMTPAEGNGGGLVVARGSLNPMEFPTMQPSLQINFLGSLWHNLIHEQSLPAVATYGYAVDYRGDHPIVHGIIDNAVAFTFEMDDVWVPIYPMLYGNTTVYAGPFDETINFGASPFVYNPVLALTNASISTTGFEVGWGDANLP